MSIDETIILGWRRAAALRVVTCGGCGVSHDPVAHERVGRYAAGCLELLDAGLSVTEIVRKHAPRILIDARRQAAKSVH